MTRNQISIIGVCFLLLSSVSFAQQELQGTYTGTFAVEGGKTRKHYGLELQITNIASGSVAGTLKVTGGDCSGDYTVKGKYSDNEFKLHSGPGEKQGCGNTRLMLTVKDGKLVGQYAHFDVELSK